MTVPTPLARDNKFRAGFAEHKDVSYNGISFPPAIHSTGSYEPVYDQSGRLMKYVKGKLRIETYIHAGCLDPVSNNVIPYYVGVAGADPNAVTQITQSGKDITTDATMATIRKDLMTSCKRLRFEAQGYGLIDLNNPADPYTNFDVDNGPKPKMVSWVPLTNKMAKIVWECEFSFSPCYAAGVNPSTVAQFPFSVAIHTGPGGLTTRTITGTYETALTRINGVSKPFDLKAQELAILKYFPILKQFKREQNFNFHSDRKTLDFTITDTEINSDDAFAPGCENEEVEMSISGALNPGGFRKWSVTMSGSIDLMAGTPKVVAYNEISRLFDHYFQELAYKGESPVRSSIPKWVEGLTILKGFNDSRSIPILRSVKLSDHIFSRSVRFNFNWDLFVSLETLFKATGLFVPFEADNRNRDRDWKRWKISAETVMNIGGYQELGFTQENDIIVSLCQPILGKAYNLVDEPPYGNTYPKDKKPDPSKTTEDSSSDANFDLYNMIQHYLHVETENGTLSHSPLSYLPPAQETLVNNLSRTQYSQYHKEGTDERQVQVRQIIHKIRPTNYTLVSTGCAVRLGYPVPYVNLTHHGDQPLYKVGNDILKPYKMENGVDVTTGKNYSIHGLVWQKRYALAGPPANTNTVSDGHSISFPG